MNGVPLPPNGSPQLMNALALALLLLAPLSIAGVAFVNTGLGRSRSAAQALLGNLAILAVSAIGFAIVGASLAAAVSGTGMGFVAAGKSWAWIGVGPLLLGGFRSAALPMQLQTIFEFLAVAMAAIIPWGSGADRLRILAGCVVAALTAVVVFPIAAYWTWGGGWLGSLGLNFKLGLGFLDPAGAATVHALGGLSALAVVWIAGPRRGKFPKEGLSTAMPGHNAVYVLFGCIVALVGWMAWNAAGAILWLHEPSLALLPVTVVNTLLCGSGAILATFTVTRIRFGKPDASLCANGWLAGLVASSACAALITPGAALFIGIVAGIMTPLLVEVLELALSIDDPTGAITVHGASALWGLFAVGFFAPGKDQVLAQLVGIAALLGILFPFVYLLFALLDRVVPFRADAEGERIGMDLHELGGGAYPEFVIHRDDSYR
jgi:Amt family ammonium transporter